MILTPQLFQLKEDQIERLKKSNERHKSKNKFLAEENLKLKNKLKRWHDLCAHMRCSNKIYIERDEPEGGYK